MKTALTWIHDHRFLAVMRTLTVEQVSATAKALYDGGIHCIEVTVQSSESFMAINTLVREMTDVLVGAGTVLTVDEVRRAVDSGAQYIVSPNVDPDVIRETKRLGVLSIPGAMTPTEVVDALRAGADLIKIFPASAVGPQFFREMKGPLPSIRLLAVGGINAQNAADFVHSGAYGVAIGGYLVAKDLVDARRYQEITDRARMVMDAVRGALQTTC